MLFFTNQQLSDNLMIRTVFVTAFFYVCRYFIMSAVKSQMFFVERNENCKPAKEAPVILPKTG